VFKGQGIEFSEVREFHDGDDIRAIDWKVSARLGHPYVKLFTEEREQNVFLLVDRSGSLDFGSRGGTKQELAAEVAAVLAFCAISNKDRVGLLLFTDREELHLRPSRGRRHVLRIVRELLACETHSARTNLKGAIEHLLQAVKRKSIVFIVSDLLDDGYESPLRALAAKHEVKVLHVGDPLELELPAVPAMRVEDRETGAVTVLRPGQVRTLKTRSAQWRAERAAGCRRAGADYAWLQTGTDYLPALLALLEKGGRR
jgi:uncharacterized protein (DUF58 family)